MSLEEAAPEVKLAVDLIYLLERNALPAEVVLAALEIVKRDYLKKTTITALTKKVEQGKN